VEDVVHLSGVCLMRATGSEIYKLNVSDTVLFSLSFVVRVILNSPFHSRGTLI
jgi:hypothetical protein